MRAAYWLDEDLKYHDPATLRASAETLLDALYEASELRRKAKTKHLPQLEIVLLGLFKASHTEDHCMAVQLDSNRFSDMKHLSYRVTVELIVNGLIQLGLLIKQFCKPVHLVYLTCLLKRTKPSPSIIKIKNDLVKTYYNQVGIFIVFLRPFCILLIFDLL